MPLTIKIASVPDRESLVAEIWDGPAQIAELNWESGDLHLEVYARPPASRLSVPFDEFVAVLEKARAQLGPKPRPGWPG